MTRHLTRRRVRPAHRERPARREHGQILVLFMFALVVMIGVAALVIDVGMVYATQRSEKSITDSAALAGAQQLQKTGSRILTDTERTNARAVALQNLVNSLPGASMPGCSTSSNVVRCDIPGTPYRASISTPVDASLCSGCDTDRAILVSLTRVSLPTTFGRVFNKNGWDVSQASVGLLEFKGKYAVITLRPPRPNPRYTIDWNYEDVYIQGTNTSLILQNGDIGVNTDVHVVSGNLVLDPGFTAWHYDEGWPVAGVPDKQMSNIIPDPGYTFPSRSDVPGTSIYATEAAAKDAAGCAGWQAKVPLQYKVGGVSVKALPASSVTCYKPGIYASSPSASVSILEPGVYFFENSGLNLASHATIIGGFEANKPGVALVFKECNSAACVFNGNNADLIALNGGDRYANPTGVEATAAIDFAGNPVQTSPTAAPPNQPLTMLVRKDTNCYPVWDPAWPPSGSWVENGTCDDTHNNTINMAGGGSLYLGGITYAPSDNVKIDGGSSGMGYVGQIVAWTVKYTGGTQITQRYPDGPDNGVLRLNDACSGTNSNNPKCYP